MFKRLLQTTNDPVQTIVRLTLGVVFFAHGAQKALGWFGGYGFAGTLEGFSKMGVPLPLALFVILAEFVGSLALISGIFARIASAAIFLLMAGAIATVHGQFGFFMNWFGQQKGEGFEYHLLAVGLAVAVLIRGAGALSIDRLLLNGKRELNPTGTSSQTVPSPSQLAQ
jgi:putative oxidoreductase